MATKMLLFLSQTLPVFSSYSHGHQRTSHCVQRLLHSAERSQVQQSSLQTSDVQQTLID